MLPATLVQCLLIIATITSSTDGARLPRERDRNSLESGEGSMDYLQAISIELRRRDSFPSNFESSAPTSTSSPESSTSNTADSQSAVASSAAASSTSTDPSTSTTRTSTQHSTSTATADTASTTNTPTSSSSTSTPTSSALPVSAPFHWNAGSIAAAAVILGFFGIGCLIIGFYQVRRFRAWRKRRATTAAAAARGGRGGVYKLPRGSPSPDIEADRQSTMFQRDSRPGTRRNSRHSSQHSSLALWSAQEAQQLDMTGGYSNHHHHHHHPYRQAENITTSDDIALQHVHFFPSSPEYYYPPSPSHRSSTTTVRTTPSPAPAPRMSRSRPSSRPTTSSASPSTSSSLRKQFSFEFDDETPPPPPLPANFVPIDHNWSSPALSVVPINRAIVRQDDDDRWRYVRGAPPALDGWTPPNRYDGAKGGRRS